MREEAVGGREAAQSVGADEALAKAKQKALAAANSEEAQRVKEAAAAKLAAGKEMAGAAFSKMGWGKKGW